MADIESAHSEAAKTEADLVWLANTLAYVSLRCADPAVYAEHKEMASQCILEVLKGYTITPLHPAAPVSAEASSLAG